MTDSTPVILQVDDNNDILATVRIALESLGGLSVTQCSSGTQALEIAPDLLPDLFLLDVMMPGIDGIETMQGLRKIKGCEQTPVIFMTAKASSEDQEMLLECGAVSVIKKPFDPLTLASEIIHIWTLAFQKRMTDNRPK